MSEQAPRRRLAAILAADVVGYSRMMQADEAGTLAALKSRRTEILQPLVSKHHGRIIKVMGDRVLVEFASAVQAVSCAVALQEAMAVANEAAEESRRVVLRIGINLSDVMVEGGDLYGDGVNIASRLEGMAEPGGIWVSGKVREEAAGKIGCEFVDLGEQTLKNIAGPVRAYRIQLRGSAVPAPAAVTLPEKPSIAVLPLVNMSGDHEQEFFADGLTEDIITALSRISGLWVIARTSTFTYKGKPADVKQVARELGVRYVMEGSVRRSGQHLRVTTQLVDAATGHHVWAERYDRTVADLFEIQDDITRGVAATTETQVYLAERTAPALSPSAQLTARDLVARAMARTYDQTPEALAEASSLVEEALRADARDATWAEPKIVCKALDARRIGLEPGVLAKLLPHISVATVWRWALAQAMCSTGSYWPHIRLRALLDARKPCSIRSNATGLADAIWHGRPAPLPCLRAPP